MFKVGNAAEVGAVIEAYPMSRLLLHSEALLLSAGTDVDIYPSTPIEGTADVFTSELDPLSGGTNGACIVALAG